MRPIIFRGKRVENGEWVYGYVDATMYKDLVVIHSEASTQEVNPETVGQFTGLHDKNGKEIYEGDVVDLFVRPALVKYDGGKFVFERIHDSEIIMQYGIENFGECEVIGNIHDGKEETK